MKFNYPKNLSLMLILALMSGATGCTDSMGPVSGLNELTSWSETQAAAYRQQLPIILLVEQRHCGFCQALKKDLFRPLANDADYGSRAVFISMLVDFDAPLIEKGGKMISGFEFSEQFSASTTPTILFLDSAADELQERIVGYETSAQYIQTLKSRIDASASALR